jgi:hypothetical protein
VIDSRYYLLDDDNQPHPVDFEEMCAWRRSTENFNVLRKDDVAGVVVSTIFLGIDHGFGDGLPVLWETMVFRREADGSINYTDIDGERYTSHADAIAGHTSVIDHALAGKYSKTEVPT